MPALATVVSDYLDQVKASLKPTTANPNTLLVGPGANYLRSQDMQAVLQLLVDATDPGTVVCDTGSTASVIEVTALVANSQVGNVLTFAGNVTAGIAGEVVTVISNDNSALTVSPALSEAPVIADTFTVSVDFLNSEIDSIAQGASLGNAPTANQYVEWIKVLDAADKLALHVGATAISGLNVNMLTRNAIAGGTDTVFPLNIGTQTLKTDELKGLHITVTAIGTAKIASNTEAGVVTLETALASAPGAVSCTVFKSAIDTDADNVPNLAGGQPGWNYMLSDIIDQLDTLVTAYVVMS